MSLIAETRPSFGVKREEKAMAQTTNQRVLNPAAVGKDEGDAYWWFGSLAVIKARAADTGGQLALIEVTEPPGAEAPLHVHHREDEGFWILEGEATFEVGGETIAARAGDYLFGPRDIPHRYSVSDAGCRMLFILTPGGFEELVIAMSEPAATRKLPLTSDQTADIDMDQVAANAEAFGCELVAG
jgi:quercetin dioxygenase-like cupin family protein